MQAVAAPLFTSQSGRDLHLLSPCQFGGEELRVMLGVGIVVGRIAKILVIPESFSEFS